MPPTLWRSFLTFLILVVLAFHPGILVADQASGMAEVLAQIEKIPRDPNLLGTGPARARVKEYEAPFQLRQYPGADGTPLAAAIAIHRDGKRRPGVVLAHGFTETKNQKYIVELSALLHRNGWHVLAIDYRGHGESRKLSQAPITFGWKEADDILAGAKFLRDQAKPTSVAVLGFSMGGRSAVKAMVKDGGQLLQAGLALSGPIGPPAPVLPPDPKVPLTPIDRYFLGYLGAPSFHDYWEKSASHYGVTRQFLESEARADTTIAQVKAPLLMVYAFDDGLRLAQFKSGQHEGGHYSLRYRDAVKDNPNIATLLVDRGGHAGFLYLSDPNWFGTMVMTYLKYWQARQADYLTVQAPTVDLVIDGKLESVSATYTVLVRNHRKDPVSNLKLYVSLPPDAKLVSCWLGVEGLSPCSDEGGRVTWTIPKISGGKTTAGPFVAVLGTGALKPGKFDLKAWIDAPGILPQEVTLEKKVNGPP
ncbi:MAG TPA: alpha/beta fold hydrolase [Dehalococcoidia bacterium]|jgi:predicted alpha/beta-fold hydrolase|nr:alpha/beta fold hydrolase [Dehalococcoidia bacterium]